MKKIYTGLLGIVAVMVVVGVSAYALFSDTVNITGMVLGTQSPDLLIRADHESSSYGSTLDMSSFLLDKLSPGDKDHGFFLLKNNSATSGNGSDPWDPLNFSLKGVLTTAGGDWGALKDALQIRVFVDGTSPDPEDGWATLDTWNTAGVNFPGDPLGPGLERKYVMEVRLPASFGNEVAGKTLTGVQFEITGTQAN